MKRKDDKFNELWLGFRNGIIEATTPKKRIKHSKTLDAENRFTIECIATDSVKQIVKN